MSQVPMSQIQKNHTQKIVSKIAGTGSYLPKKILSNTDLEKIIDTTDEWIFTRTGIRERHIAATGEFTSDLALEAAKNAIVSAGIDASAIDLIIVATTTPDKIFPSVATMLQRKLGVAGCPAFDIQAVCSGFIYALATADNFIKASAAKCVLVIGAETFSRITECPFVHSFVSTSISMSVCPTVIRLFVYLSVCPSVTPAVSKAHHRNLNNTTLNIEDQNIVKIIN